MMKAFYYSLFCASLLMLTHESQAHWTSVFHKKLNETDLAMARNNTIIFTKNEVSPFTQLLFSWNALRPKQGHFSFYVQVRDSQLKKWGSWHRMADWGQSIQRSYQSKGDAIARYVHVRLEMNENLGDAFRIKVVGNKSPLDLLKAFAVTISNTEQFKPELFNKKIEKLSTVMVKNVPKISQFALNHEDSHRICSPTSCTMLTRYLTGFLIDPIDFAKKSYDNGLEAYGSWPFNMAHAFEHGNGKNWFFNTRLNSFAELHRQLARNIPVIVSVRGTLEGAPKSYTQGHLLVVVGWDAQKKQVICHDPATEKHYQTLKQYEFSDFVKAWELSHRLVYWVEPV